MMFDSDVHTVCIMQMYISSLYKTKGQNAFLIRSFVLYNHIDIHNLYHNVKVKNPPKEQGKSPTHWRRNPPMLFIYVNTPPVIRPMDGRDQDKPAPKIDTSSTREPKTETF